eukprot:g1752.t1
MACHRLLFSSRSHLHFTHSPGCTGVRQNRSIHSRRRSVFILAVTSPSGVSKDCSVVEWRDDFHESFILERNLGHGSFGEVWLATERKTKKQFAVKELPKQRGRLSVAGTLIKIDREVSIMRNLISCPTTVQFKECYVLPKSYKIVMEYCSGLDLKEQIKTHGTVSEKVVAHIAHEILMILKLCHENGIIHGDVKTANFILQSNKCDPFQSHDVTALKPGWLKAIDFGCSQYLMDGCRMSSRVGTPVFMAPEVFDRDYGFESDLWSLGVVLYQLISGRFPFWSSTRAALTSSFDDVMDKVHLKDPDFTSAPFNRVSSSFIDFMRGLLDKNYCTRATTEEALSHPFIEQNVQHFSGQKMGSNIVPTGSGSFKSATL